MLLDEHGFPIPEPKEVKAVWDCIDPCALLLFGVQTNAIPFNEKVKETLDAFGWLTDEGYPDYDKMYREFERTQ